MMALFRKKTKKEEPPPVEPPVTGGWRGFETRAVEKIEADDMASAIDNWCEAVDRFDEREKYLNKLCDGIVANVVGLVVERAKRGDESPTNLINDIDIELRAKHPENDRDLSDDTYRAIVGVMPESEDTDEMLLLCTAASGCVMGFMRRALDIRHVRKRCLDAAEMCMNAEEAIRRLPRGRNAGIHPKSAAKCAASLGVMFKHYAYEIDTAIFDMTPEELDQIRDSWKTLPDRYYQITEVLDSTYRLIISNFISRGKLERRRDSSICDYVSGFIAGYDPMIEKDIEEKSL